jgi:hypothetical protein
MNKLKIKPVNIIDHIDLPVITVDRIPEKGDPVEIGKEMYFACEKGNPGTGEVQKIGVIPLVVKNPSTVSDIEDYLNCLSIAHRRVREVK